MALGQGWGEGGLGIWTSERQELERSPQTVCLLWIEFCLPKKYVEVLNPEGLSM